MIEALELGKQGKLKPPSAIKKLGDLQSAMEDIEAGRIVGRVVLTFN